MKIRSNVSTSLLVLFIALALYLTLVSSPSVSSFSPQAVPTSLTTVDVSTQYPTVVVVVQPTTTTTTATATSTITASTTIVSVKTEMVTVTQSITNSYTSTTTIMTGIIAGVDPNMNTFLLIGGVLGGIGVGWLATNLDSSKSNTQRTSNLNLSKSNVQRTPSEGGHEGPQDLAVSDPGSPDPKKKPTK